MPAVRLLGALALKLSCVAGFVELVIADHAGWGSPLLVLFLFTRVPKY